MANKLHLLQSKATVIIKRTIQFKLRRARYCVVVYNCVTHKQISTTLLTKFNVTGFKLQSCQGLQKFTIHYEDYNKRPFSVQR